MGIPEGEAMRKGVDNGWPALLNQYSSSILAEAAVEGEAEGLA
jgi:hypothetical protein